MFKDIPEEDYQFVRQYRKLEELSKSNKYDDHLDMSGVLRQLLIDSYCMLDIMREKYDFNPNFVVGNYELRYSLRFFRFDTCWGRLYPSSCPVKMIVKRLSHREFVELPVILVSDIFVTVGDVIKYEANVRGGVHYGTVYESNIEAHRASSILIGNVRNTFLLLKPIAQVTLDALFPLYDELAKKYGLYQKKS